MLFILFDILHCLKWNKLFDIIIIIIIINRIIFLRLGSVILIFILKTQIFFNTFINKVLHLPIRFVSALLNMIVVVMSSVPVSESVWLFVNIRCFWGMYFELYIVNCFAGGLLCLVVVVVVVSWWAAHFL